MTIEFDKKLVELDAYLQMLIERSETLDRKLESASSDAEKNGLLLIKNNLESLLGSIKHAIVLLQIARSAASTIDDEPQQAEGPHQVNYQQQARQKKRHPSISAAGVSAAAIEANTFNISSSSGSSGAGDPIQAGGRDGAAVSGLATKRNYCENISDTNDSVRGGDGGAGGGGDEVEDDDDDAFYDAADITLQQQFPNQAPEAMQLINQLQQSQNSKQLNSNLNEIDYIGAAGYNSSQKQSASIMSSQTNSSLKNSLIGDGSIDWDALYEEEDEEDLGSLENQGSVIKHLLSQIRIGMDLTKVVLPTFILERRSLLEMYADFFAHPDLFSSIPDYETAEERMIQLVRWYLSAFHAGRKSSVAKKPYNPILGEIFLCHWNLNPSNDESHGSCSNSIDSSNNNHHKSQAKTSELSKINDEINIDDCDDPQQQLDRTNSTESTSSVGDVEKFSKRLPPNSLLFVAEQVSHHPPVSAFYAENSEKSISCCSHIYTKSKYLGLSIGVHNIGQGVIKLLKHNETYVCTFPSAYGRSILTVPWVELGGTVNISCEQTGYSAVIEFVTKPFYGGKKHRVMGEILRPNKEPFITIDGEWNGVMYSKGPPSSNDKQVFVDTTCLPVIKKHVRSISTQESFESRNVWKEVTRALKLHDVASATAAKSFIEQRQRDLLKDRMEKGFKWKTRYFEAVDDGWNYAKPLADRLSSTSSGSKKE